MSAFGGDNGFPIAGLMGRHWINGAGYCARATNGSWACYCRMADLGAGKMGVDCGAWPLGGRQSWLLGRRRTVLACGFLGMMERGRDGSPKSHGVAHRGW
ncbi:hypothetical protein ACLOJK_034403 [Asimina triloba]